MIFQRVRCDQDQVRRARGGSDFCNVTSTEICSSWQQERGLKGSIKVRERGAPMEDTVGHFPASDQVTTETTETTGQYQLRPSCAGGSAGQHAAGQDAWCWALAGSLTDHILATSPAACHCPPIVTLMIIRKRHLQVTPA